MVTPTPPAAASPSLASPRIQLRRSIFLVALLIVLLIGAGGWYRWMQTGLATAREAMDNGDFSRARKAINRYLRIDSHNVDALLLAGDASLQDDSLNPVDAAKQAASYYARIPDSSPSGATARSLEGRATFLILQEPGRAERLFRKSIELDRDQFDSYYLLWQLNNMTERYFENEAIFREVYRLCPKEQRAYRLREWYSSQFSPLSACSQLDLMMLFREEAEIPSEQVALRRLTAFREYEPQEPTTAAAFAQWHLRNQTRETALEALESITDRESAVRNHFYLATLVETLIEVGQLEQAGTEFQKWTSPREGYQYWRLAGIHAQEVEGDSGKAVEFLTQAIKAWPGPSDWLLMNRLSRCMALQGRREESLKMMAEAKRIEGMTDMAFHRTVRAALSQLDNPDALEDVVRFYEAFQREWEVSAWREVIDELRKMREQ